MKTFSKPQIDKNVDCCAHVGQNFNSHVMRIIGLQNFFRNVYFHNPQNIIDIARSLIFQGFEEENFWSIKSLRKTKIMKKLCNCTHNA